MAKKRLRSYKQKNERRHQLIDKKYGRWGLKKEEEVELKELMKWCGDWVNQRHPLPKFPPE